MISLGGITLVVPDKDGGLQKWLDLYLPLEALRDQSESVSLRTGRPDTRSGYRAGVGLTLANYPPPPVPKINSLYWPTGAVRWARGYFLASENQNADILEAAGSTNQSLTLLFEDEDNDTSLSAKVYLLPPRPITAGIAEDPLENLFLLPVVDQRYYWQWRNTGDLEVTNSTTWTNLYSTLSTQLGVTIAADAVHADYQAPDIDELTRRYGNAAILLDAIAHSCGQRIVANLDGTLEAINWTTSASRYTDNVATYSLLAGGLIDSQSAAITPSKVTVTFPKWREGHPDPGGDLHDVELTADAGTDTTADTVKTIHTTASADFSAKSMTPDNNADLTTLATKIKDDFYASLGKLFDFSLHALFSWSPTGYDDYLEVCYGATAHGDYTAYTRVHSRPYNFGDEEQLQRFAGMTTYPRLARFELQATLLPGESELAYFVNDSDGTTVTSDELTVFDTEGRSFGTVNERGWAEYKGDTLQWEIVSMDGSLTRAGTVVTSIIPPGLSGVVSFNGINRTAENHSGTITLLVGDKVIAWYVPKESKWYMKGGETSAPGSDPENVRLFRGVVNEPGGFDESDASISVDAVEALDAEGGEPAAPTVDNPFELWGDDNDFCLFAESPGISGSGYILIQVEQRRQPRWFEATTQSGPFDDSDATISVTTTSALDGGSHPGAVTANNTWGLHAEGTKASLIVENLDESPVEYELVQVDRDVGTTTLYKAKLNGALDSSDATATIDNVTAFGGGTAPSPTVADNILDLAGADNDDCVIVKDGAGYDLLSVVQGAVMYKAQLNGALASTDANATIDTVTTLGGGNAPSPTSAANTFDLAGDDNDACLIVKDGTGYVVIQVMHHAC